MIEGFELTHEFIQFLETDGDWEHAIVQSAQPLLSQKYVQESYVAAMIDVVKEHGPYIVIAPNIAMPHARPETGAKKLGYCITLFDKPVCFSEKDHLEARLFITLSCTNANTHIEMMQAIVTVLSDQDKHDRIFEATTAEEVAAIFS